MDLGGSLLQNRLARMISHGDLGTLAGTSARQAERGEPAQNAEEMHGNKKDESKSQVSVRRKSMDWSPPQKLHANDVEHEERDERQSRIFFLFQPYLELCKRFLVGANIKYQINSKK
jgi:hypothetical protein